MLSQWCWPVVSRHVDWSRTLGHLRQHPQLSDAVPSRIADQYLGVVHLPPVLIGTSMPTTRQVLNDDNTHHRIEQQQISSLIVLPVNGFVLKKSYAYYGMGLYLVYTVVNLLVEFSVIPDLPWF